MIDIDMSGIDDWLSDLGRAVMDCVQGASLPASECIAREQRMLAPVDTGALRQSIHADSGEHVGDRWVIGTSATQSYSVFQEYGTGYKGDPVDFDGHPIAHTAKRGWRFTDAEGERRLGLPMYGRHFMRDGAVAGLPSACAVLEQAIERGLS